MMMLSRNHPSTLRCSINKRRSRATITTVNSSIGIKPPVISPPDVDAQGRLLLQTEPVAYTLKKYRELGNVFIMQLGPTQLYWLGGTSGMKAFWDQTNILRGKVPAPDVTEVIWTREGKTAIPALNGEEFTSRKTRFVTTLTTKAAAEQYVAGMNHDITQKLKHLGSDSEPFSMYDTISELVMQGLTQQMFGYGLAEAKDLLAATQECSDNWAVFRTGDAKTTATAVKATMEYLTAVLAKYKADPQKYANTGLGIYMTKGGGATLTDAEILLDLHQALATGFYGIVSQCMFMMKSLLDHPKCREKVKEEVSRFTKPNEAPTFKTQANLPYTVAFLKEALRFWPALWVVKGLAIKDFVVDGKVIEKNHVVMCLLYATNKDAKIFPEPDKFDPDRFYTRQEGANDGWGGLVWDLPVFGWGDATKGHSCGGKMVVVQTMLLVLMRAAQHWRWEMVDPKEPINSKDMTMPYPRGGMRMRRATGLSRN